MQTGKKRSLEPTSGVKQRLNGSRRTAGELAGRGGRVDHLVQAQQPDALFLQVGHPSNEIRSERPSRSVATQPVCRQRGAVLHLLQSRLGGRRPRCLVGDDLVAADGLQCITLKIENLLGRRHARVTNLHSEHRVCLEQAQIDKKAVMSGGTLP